MKEEQFKKEALEEEIERRSKLLCLSVSPDVIYYSCEEEKSNELEVKLILVFLYFRKDSDFRTFSTFILFYHHIYLHNFWWIFIVHFFVNLYVFTLFSLLLYPLMYLKETHACMQRGTLNFLVDFLRDKALIFHLFRMNLYH